ncbi:MAG: Asp-tRNA(Asn)/Glu-tRNA(Gln) amidotransferase subunit GatC [bacterium]
MSITLEDVEKTARLAKLEFSVEEKQALVRHLDQIVAYVEQLNELDTDGVEPTSHVLDLRNIFREDEVNASMSQTDALKNAPKQKDGYFSVPKVIG